MAHETARDGTVNASTGKNGSPGGGRWRIAGWGAAALILLVPLVAMQFTDQVSWSAADFVFAAALVLAVGIPYELAVRKSGDAAYRAAVGVALAGAFLLVWINGAVGIIGSEDNPANLMYGAVLAVGVVGALVARFRPLGMARALLAAAAVQTLVTTIAVVGGLGRPWSGPLEIILLNGFFVVLFAGSAWLFREAARGAAAGDLA